MGNYKVLNLITKTVEFSGSQRECRHYSSDKTGLFVIREKGHLRSAGGDKNLGAGPLWLQPA